MTGTIHKAFAEVDASQFYKLVRKGIEDEIRSNPDEYILGVDTDDYCDYLVVNHSITPLTIDFDGGEAKRTAIREKQYNNPRYGYFENETYHEYEFQLFLPYQGNPIILQIEPSSGSSWTIGGSPQSPITIVNDHILRIQFVIHKQSKEEYDRVKDGTIKATFQNLDRMNQEILRFNEQLPNVVRDILQSIRQERKADLDFLASINASQSNTHNNKYKVPVIQSKIVAPTYSKPEQQNPYIEFQLYQQILRYIDKLYHEFEKLPRTYKDKDEESLRDSILPPLQTLFNDLSATGETFNKSGKTDICIKHTDKTNVFIGECKIWKGEKLFLEAINQLIDRYVTWNDTKVAVIVFVQNDGFTDVLNKAKTVIRTHPYYVRTVEEHLYENRGSYIFHHAEDLQRLIKLELMLYHFNQK